MTREDYEALAPLREYWDKIYKEEIQQMKNELFVESMIRQREQKMKIYDYPTS